MDRCELCGSTEKLVTVCKKCLDKLAAKEEMSSYRYDRTDTDTHILDAHSEPHTIRGIRRGMSMNQSKFAAQIGVAPNTVARWETGKVKPSSESIQKLLALTREIVEKEKGYGKVRHQPTSRVDEKTQ